MKISILLVMFIKIVVIHCLSCEEVLELPPEEKITLSMLQTISPKDMIQCLAHLTKEEIPAPEADFIWKALKTFYGGIENIPDSVLTILHWVTVAVAPEEYANITLNNIDVIQNFGLDYKLNEEQMTAIANRVRNDFAEKEPEDYTYYDLSALRQILCAFNKTEIERINPVAYRETALLIGKLEDCNAEVMSGFANLAVDKRAFGPSNYWSERTIKIIGKVADYVSKESPRKNV